MGDQVTLPAGAGDPEDATAGRIGRFEVRSTLGSGGMGVVFEAYDAELERRVAIKLLRPGAAAGAEATARLQREAQAMARLSHPNVVAIYEVGRFGEQVFIAMELVDGSTLRAWLREPRPWREVVTMFVAAGRGLAAAHAAGLVHRDVKPDNVLVGRDGRPRVGDFGLVASAGQDVDAPALGAIDVSLTVGGSAIGTPGYMSPEHWRGAGTDARSDQFSFCVALWEALWRARPFAGDTPAAIRAAVTAGELVEPPPSDVPARIASALRRGLAGDPAARWPSLAALLDELEARARPRRPPVVAVGGAAALIAGAVVYGLARSGPPASPCAQAADELAAVWNDQARARVGAALGAVAVPYASAIAARATARIDELAADWSRMSIDSCEATHVRHEQSAELLDRRALCLDERRRELAALVDLLGGEPDVATVDAALRATYALGELAACADGERLLAMTAPLPAERRSRADELDARVARARNRFLTGHPREGWAELEPALADIRGFGHPPLTARALLAAADLQIELDALPAAVTGLEEALAQAAQARDDLLLARAGVQLINVIGHKQRSFVEVDRLIPVVSALVTRAGDPPALRALFLKRQGEVEDLQMRQAPARQHLEESLALLEPGQPDPELMAALHALGTLYANAGEYARARPLLERATALAIELYGERHPNVGRGLNNLGYQAQLQGDFAAALDYYQRAFDNKVASLGLENATTARSLANVGVALALRGRIDEAVPKLEQAIAIFERTLGPGHAEVGQNLGNLASIYGDLGRHDDARAALERALAIEIAAYGERHADVAYLHESLARIEEGARRYPEAIAAADRALALRRAVLGEDHPLSGLTWGLRGAMRASAGDCAAAIKDVEKGRAIVLRAEGPDALHLIKLDTQLAECLVALGRARDGVAAAERALALAVRKQVTDAGLGQAQFAAALARDAAGTAPRTQTRALAADALATLRASGPDSSAEIRRIEAWLAAHPS